MYVEWWCRLLDFTDAEDVSLSQINVVALDECDRMLSLGFAPELSRLRTMLLEPPSGSAAAGYGAASAAPTAAQSSRDNPTQDTTAPLPKQGKKQRKKPGGVPLRTPGRVSPPQPDKLQNRSCVICVVLV